MMNQIGFRNYGKRQSNQGKSEEELASQWQGGAIYSDELQVLQHVAFKRMTSGDASQRSKPQIFAGTNEDGQDGISIQSSINYLSEILKKQMPTITQVLKFGLLKAEGVSLMGESLSGTDLTKLNFSFTHFSFQEFLTARYFAEMMNENHEQDLVDFVTRHRNEPRYLMTLKFLAGILSAGKDEKAEQNIKIFWDAVMCNTDGVLELGVETKISLLMHLLSQTRKGDKIDKRIPHLDEAVKLIDSVVLGDLSCWKTQLRESDYTSDNIREGLIEYFVNGKINWIYEKSLQLKKQINPNLKREIHSHIVSRDDIIDIIGRMIHKFTEAEVEEIFFKGYELLKGYNETEWRQKKKVIELFIMINRKSNIEDTIKEQVFLSHLNTVHDDNLNEISSKAIKELISKPQNLLLRHKLCNSIRESLRLENILTEAQHKRMWTRVKLGKYCGLCEPDLKKKILDVLIQLSLSPNQEIGKLATKNFIKFIETVSKDDPKIVEVAVELLLPSLNESQSKWKIQISTSKTLKKIMKFSDKNEIPLFKRVFSTLKFLLEKSNRDVTILLSRRIRKLVVMTNNNHNTDLIMDAAGIFMRLLEFPDAQLKATSAKNVVELIKKKGCRDSEVSKKVVDNLIILSRSPNSYINNLASTNLNLLLRCEKKLIAHAIHGLIPLLEAPEDNVRNKALDSIVIMCNNNGIELARIVLNQLVGYWKNPNEIGSGKRRELRIIIELLKITGNDDKELVKNLIQMLVPFLNNPDPENRISALNCLTEVVKGDMELVQRAINAFKSRLKDSDLIVRKTASKNIMLLVKEGDPQMLDSTVKDLLEFSKNSEWNMKTSVAEIIGGLQSGNSKEVLNILIPLLQDRNSDVRTAASNSMIDFLKTSGENHSFDIVQRVLESLIPLLEDESSHVRLTISENLQELMDLSGNHFLRDIIKTLASLIKDSNPYVRKIGEFNMVQLFKMKSHDSNVEVLQKILTTVRMPLNHSDPNIRLLVAKKILELMSIGGGSSDDQLFQDVVDLFEPRLSESDWKETELASSSLIEALRRRNKQEPQLVQKIMNVLTHFLENSSDRDEKASAANYLIEIMEIGGNGCRNSKLIEKIFQMLIAHLHVRNHDDLNISSSKNLIKLAMIQCDDVSKFGVTDVIEGLMLAPRVRDFDHETRVTISNGMISLLNAKSKGNPELVPKVIETLAQYLGHSNVNLVELSSNILKGAFLILLETPETLPKYFHHTSRKLRCVLTSTLSSCLKAYVQNFQALDELFQSPKSSLTLANIINLYNHHQIHLSEEAGQRIQRDLDDLQNLQRSHFSDEHVSRLKTFLASELDQIESLTGPQIIKLALVVTSKETESKDCSDHQELIDLAQETLNIQVKYLNDEGLMWIFNNHDKLLALSPETKCFYRKVCDKMLEDNVITPLEEQLMIKFINQGLTISLTKSGEVIFEERCYKLKGNDIEQALEKIAKTIIKQQQDILALQYKENKPIFAKNFIQGIKEAAADKKEVKSIVDSRFLLKNDSWLLTILNPKISGTEIIILEHRSAFGDHFLCHLSEAKVLRWYPDEVPALKDIFGCYVRGEFYRGEIKELRYEDGQKLFESKDKNQIYHIQGELISNQIYFQQELLREGSEDRNQATEEDLETKLDNKRKVLENYLESLNLLDLQKEKILEYYEGLVSTFGSIYISSLAIAVGEIAIDDGMDFFSLSNLFKQLCSYAPFDIGNPLFDTFEAIRSHIKTTPVRNKANFVKDIAIDAVEASDLVGQIALDIISKAENRQRIFDAKEDELDAKWLKKITHWVMGKFEKLKKKAKDYEKLRDLFLAQIKTTPAFQLGINDANKIVKKWIEIKQIDPNLRMSPDKKRELFTEAAIINEV